MLKDYPYRIKVLPSIDNTHKHQNGVEASETGHRQVHRDVYFNKNNSVKIQQTVGFYISSTISLSFFFFLFLSVKMSSFGKVFMLELGLTELTNTKRKLIQMCAAWKEIRQVLNKRKTKREFMEPW